MHPVYDTVETSQHAIGAKPFHLTRAFSRLGIDLEGSNFRSKPHCRLESCICIYIYVYILYIYNVNGKEKTKTRMHRSVLPGLTLTFSLDALLWAEQLLIGFKLVKSKNKALMPSSQAALRVFTATSSTRVVQAPHDPYNQHAQQGPILWRVPPWIVLSICGSSTKQCSHALRNLIHSLQRHWVKQVNSLPRSGRDWHLCHLFLLLPPQSLQVPLQFSAWMKTVHCKPTRTNGPWVITYGSILPPILMFTGGNQMLK